jgi:hypothetical protein
MECRITELEARIELLTKFFKGVMWGCGGEWCDNLDGGDLQDMAEQQGLIVQTTMHEPCGEICACADVMGSDGFPLTCYRYVEWLEKHHEEITTDRTDHPTVHGHGTG